MGERHDAEHSVAQARQRLSEIADELSRRASGDYVRGRAREKVDDLTTRAKVMARERTIDMKDRAMDNPWVLAAIGGTVGVVAGKVIGNFTRKARHGGGGGEGDVHEGYEVRGERGQGDRPYDEWVATHPAEGGEVITEDRMYGLDQPLGENLEFQGSYEERLEVGEVRPEGGGRMDKMKEKAGHLKERASNIGSNIGGRAKHAGSQARHAVGDRMPNREQIRGRASHMREYVSRDKLKGGARRMGHSASSNAGLWTLGAMVVGALFGSLVPVSRRERQMFGPAKGAAKDELRTMGHEAVDKAKEVKGRVQEAVTSSFSGEKGEQKGGETSVEGRELQSAPGTFTTGGIEGGSSEQSEEGGTWTPTYEPDVTRH